MTYTYDGDGKRVKKSNGTLYWTGPGWDPLLETDLSGNATEEYVFFNGERVARVDMPANSVEYYFPDHLKSTDIVTNATGGIVRESDYVPYGGEVVISGTDPNRYKFTGKERDPESGLDDFDARFYSSPFGRFMTPDWEAKPTDVPYANFGNPQSLNLYSYVQNNPTTVGDPDGHECAVCTETWNEMAKLVDEGTKDGQNLIKAGGAGGRILGGAAAIYIGQMINPFTTVNAGEQSDIANREDERAEAEEKEQEAEPQASSDGASQGNGRGGKQNRLNQLGNDDKVSSSDRGWIKQDQNAIKSGKRDTVRVPPGKEMAHARGREAAKGFSHTKSPSSLQNIQNHRTQHKFDNKGKKNKKKE